MNKKRIWMPGMGCYFCGFVDDELLGVDVWCR